MTGFHERPCAACRQVLTDDESGLCEDCQTGVLSQRPGSVTGDQLAAIRALLADQGLTTPRQRNEVICRAVPGWRYASELGLSRQQAGDVLELLEDRRLSQEARGQ